MVGWEGMEWVVEFWFRQVCMGHELTFGHLTSKVILGHPNGGDQQVVRYI